MIKWRARANFQRFTLYKIEIMTVYKKDGLESLVDPGQFPELPLALSFLLLFPLGVEL